MRTPVAGVAASLLLLAIAGCLGGEAPAAETTQEPYTWTPCEHPWPCGDGSEWDPNLTGPFEIQDPIEVRVASFDGVELYGALWLPAVPEGVKVPVILESSPYYNQCPGQSILNLGPDNIGIPCRASQMDPVQAETRDVKTFVEAGYGYAIFNVRGTGYSGGCFDHWGADEQKDQAFLVEWLAQQPWSSGRVAMYGISYMGTTPWEAAIQDPPSLKTIVVAGIISDPYIGTFTPQGGAIYSYSQFDLIVGASLGVAPPFPRDTDWVQYATVAHERACPGVAEMLTSAYAAAYGDDRNADFWTEHRLVSGFPNVTTSVLVAQGFMDDSFHRYQEDAIWHQLPQAPKAMILGQWGHNLFFDRYLDAYPHGNTSVEIYLEWFDFWLKGLGDPPERLGRVDYQDDADAWHETTAWPPVEVRHEALYLTEAGLRPNATEGSWSFLSSQLPAAHFCSLFPGTHSVLFVSESPTEPVLIAGNPFLHLQVESTAKGGQFKPILYDVPAGWTPCSDGEAQLLTWGGVDLRFHQGNMMGRDYPIDTPNPIRSDLYNIAHVLEPGRALLVVVTNAHELEGQPYLPTITLHGDATPASSHLVVPIVQGTLGGAPSNVDYPARPFLPLG